MKLSVISLFLSIQVFAGENLNSVLSNYEITEQVPKLEASISYIENVAIRVGTEKEQQTQNIDNDLQVRLSLNGYDEQIQKERLYKNQQRRLEANRLEVLNEELALVYKLYLKLHFGLHEKKKLGQLLEVAQDQVRITNILIKKGRATITDLVSIEQKINRVKNDLIIKKTDLNKTLELFNGLLGKRLSLTDISLMDALKPYQYIAEIVKKSKGQIKSIDLEVERADLEYNLEVGENQKVFDFIQLDLKKKNVVSYDNEAEESQVGVTLAINLPFFRDKTRVNEKFINKLKAEYNAKLHKKAYVAEIDELKLNILRYAESLDQLIQSSYLTRTKKYLNVYRRSKGVEPLKLLELNNTLISGQIEKIQLQSNLYISFVSYLKERGILANYANKNVLDVNFKGEV